MYSIGMHCTGYDKLKHHIPFITLLENHITVKIELFLLLQ